jgi:SPOR domain
MGHFAGTARSAMLIFAGMTIAALSFGLAGADAAAAAKKSKAAAPAAPASAADQAKQQSAQTRQAYEAGIKSFSGGKYQPAVDELSGALRGGGLGSAEMAKAMYIRGLAYKKLNKTGLAISDLTSALWLKNGLGESDQKNAISERAEAYRLAGLGDGNSGADHVVVANPNPTPAGAKISEPVVAAASPPAAVGAPAVPAHTGKKKAVTQPAVAPPPAPAVAEVTRQSPDSQSARDAANARKLASTPVETGGLQAAAVGSLVSDKPRVASLDAAPVAAAAAVSEAPAVAAPVALTAPAIPAPIPAAVSQTAAVAAPVLSAAPIETAAAPASAATSGLSLPKSVTGFFSNMFSGSSKTAETQASASPITTASTTPAPAAPTAVGAAPGTGQKIAAVQAAAPAATAPVQAAAVQPKGKYKIHIAAVRSRAEAEALAQKLAAQNGAALKNRAPVVDEAVIGSMGTFYRVRVGSYATADEPRGVCNTLRTSGFDCLVVTN